MSLMIKVLKNKTSGDVTAFGTTIRPGGSFTVPYIQYEKLADESCELHALILDGSLVMNNGSRDLSPEQGHLWARLLAFDINFAFTKIQSSDCLVIPENQEMLVGSGKIDVDGILDIEGEVIIDKI